MSILTELGPADVERQRRLRRMKWVATGLLGVMAVIFVVMYRLQDTYGWASYVRAAAEAGMVGALADWFAVTALFRHPLGLPIPHTAVIPRRKDAIGESLSDFVATNFLAEDVVREKLTRFSVAGKVGEFLTAGGSERIVAEAAGLVRGITAVLSDDEIAGVLESMALRRLNDLEVGPMLGKIGADVIDRGDHHNLVDVVIDRAHSWIDRNPQAILTIISARAPGWTPRFIDDKISERVYVELESFVRAVRDDPQHQVRISLDRLLSSVMRDLQNDPETKAKAEKLKERLLANTSVRGLAGSVWESAKQALLTAAEDPNSSLRRSAVKALDEFGGRLQTDPRLAAKVDGWAGDAAGYVARNHARSITGIIDETISRWDGEATSKRIELMVGRDLQFIRINGTVVGALAGLAIHTVAQLLF